MACQQHQQVFPIYWRVRPSLRTCAGAQITRFQRGSIANILRIKKIPSLLMNERSGADALTLGVGRGRPRQRPPAGRGSRGRSPLVKNFGIPKHSTEAKVAHRVKYPYKKGTRSCTGHTLGFLGRNPVVSESANKITRLCFVS